MDEPDSTAAGIGDGGEKIVASGDRNRARSERELLRNRGHLN